MNDRVSQTALAQADKPFSLVPATFDDAMKIAQSLSKSDLVPKDYKGKPENIVVAIAWGQEIGLQPLQALQNIAVINGRASVWGDAALAVAMAHPQFEDIIEEISGEGEKRVATCTIKRKGRSPVTRTFSVADARRAKLWEKEGPWKNYPDRMLAMRARGFAMRDCFPDAMRGFMLAEELEGIEEKDVTPPRPAVQMPTSSKPAADVQDAEIVDTETGEISQPDQQQTEAPAKPAEGVATISAGQLKVVRAKLKNSGIEEGVICAAWDVDRLEAIPASDVNKVLDRIKAFAAGGQ